MFRDSKGSAQITTSSDERLSSSARYNEMYVFRLRVLRMQQV